MGLASCFAKWRVDLLVHHRGTHLVAERADAFQLDGAAVLHPQRHNLGQRQQYRIYTQGRRRGRIDDILALFIGRHRLSLRHGSDTPFLLALPFAFDFLDKSDNNNILSWVIKGFRFMPRVEVSARHRRVETSTKSYFFELILSNVHKTDIFTFPLSFSIPSMNSFLSVRCLSKDSLSFISVCTFFILSIKMGNLF